MYSRRHFLKWGFHISPRSPCRPRMLQSSPYLFNFISPPTPPSPTNRASSHLHGVPITLASRVPPQLEFMEARLESCLHCMQPLRQGLPVITHELGPNATISLCHSFDETRCKRLPVPGSWASTGLPSSRNRTPWSVVNKESHLVHFTHPRFTYSSTAVQS